jgi:thiazole synthase
MLAASKTNVLPINTHFLDQDTGPAGLIIGFGDVLYDQISEQLEIRRLVKMININHQVTADAAVAKTMLAVNLTNERVIKLEVLNGDLKTSNNRELIRATNVLRSANSGLIVMPLLACNFKDARTLVELGCPLLRIMGSPIGSGEGITNPDEFARICELNVPIILDGGVGSFDHFRFAVELGASGCLVNSVLFDDGRRPEVVLKEFMEEFQCFLKHSDWIEEHCA